MSMYEETISMIGKLNEDDLQVVNTIVKRFVFGMSVDSDVYKPLGEDEFFGRLETARRHSDEGRVKEAHEVARNIKSKHMGNL